MQLRATAAILLLVGSALTPCRDTLAQPAIQRVTMAEAFRAFAANSLELQIARSGWSEAEGIAQQLRAYSNPEFSLVREDLGHSGEGYWETTAGVIQRVEWPGRTAARARLADHTAGAATARLRADSLRLAFEVRKAYVRAWGAEGAERTVRRAATVLQAVADAAERRLAEGDISAYDARRRRLERLRAEQETETAALHARAARRQLAALIAPSDAGRASREVGPAEGPAGLPPELTAAVALEAAAGRPDIAAAARDLDAARARSAMAATGWVPDPTFNLGYKEQADGFSGAALAVNLPMPVFDRGAGARQGAAARETAARHRMDLAVRLAEIDVGATADRYASARSRLEAAGDAMTTEAEALLATAQTAYAEGAMTLLELLDAAAAFRDARLSALSLRSAAWTAHYDLLRAMGREPEEEG